MTQVVILGAGFAGLSAAWLLKQRGVDFVVLEQQPYPGGLARSFEWHGFYCDFAAHRLFTNNEAVLQQLLALVPMGRHIRRSRIYMRGHWLRDPLDVFEMAFHLPVADRLKVLWTYLTRPRDLAEDSFQNYVLRRYGRGLYQVFFQPYTEKLFGIPSKEISVLWARRKVRLANPLDNILRANTKTKFQYFYYPLRHGYGAIVDRLYNEVQEHVFLNARVLGLQQEAQRITAVIYERGGTQYAEPVEAVVSTLPLTVTSRMLGHALALRYQKVDAVYLLVNRPFTSDNHWFYFTDQDIAINRLVEFKNMSALETPEKTTVICAEVTQPHADVATKVIADLTRVGLVRREEILDTKVVREEFAYPVYDQLYDETLRQARAVLGKFENLYVVGRAAEFEHREVDDNFAAAQETVEKIWRQMPMPAPKKELPAIEARVPARVFAVVLALNNCEDTLECLQSVTALAHPDVRVVLVDNGSTDGTPALVRERFPSAHVIENGRNLGVPAGYNVGFAYSLEACADYILMLNNDTVVAPDMLSALLADAASDPKTGILMPKVLYYGSDDRVWSGGWRYRRFPPAIVLDGSEQPGRTRDETPRLIEYAPSCGLLIHRHAFERAGLFDPGYLFLYDDWDFSERVRAHGLHIRYVPRARMWHKVSRTTGGPRSRLFWHTFAASGVRFYRRHGRPVWFALPIHMGYIAVREFVFKGNWAYLPDFWQGLRDGLRQPLGTFPKASSTAESQGKAEES